MMRRKNLSELSTFRMGGMADKVVALATPEAVADFFAALSPDEPILMIGKGSNIVFPDGGVSIPVVLVTYDAITILKEEGDTIFIEAGAGLSWDTLVEWAVAHEYAGIEALSYIPGAVGAAPVQNIGAYGVEAKDVIESVRVYDRASKEYKVLSNTDCAFGYRDSIFKHEGKGRYVIVSVVFRLRVRGLVHVPAYPGVAEALAERGVAVPTLKDIREVIIAIRQHKLPDVETVASVGSFFKNAIVPKEQADALKEKFPRLAVFAVDATHSKIGTGSMLDILGYKGAQIGNLGFYENNALVLVHHGGATRAELDALIAEVTAKVYEAFGVAIEPEAELL